MNLELRVVIRQLGLLLFLLSALIGCVGVFALFDGAGGQSMLGADTRALITASVVGFACGVLLFAAGRRTSGLLGHREALLLVAASWLIGAGLSALPFRLWATFRPDAAHQPHNFDAYVDCYFEAMSGLTTTGATVVQVLGTLPRSLLLWRALTHWLGGLGIVVLFVAVLPILGGGGARIYRAEAPGPSPEAVKPRIRDTARTLWLIYTGLTITEILALRLCGMTLFDAVCHTFATLATGGFSTRDASIGAYPSVAIHVVILVFMVLAGINFALYHQLLQRRWHSVRKDPELRLYLTIILVATVVVTTSLMIRPVHGSRTPADETPEMAITLREALFQVVSIQTTTGFCSTDFDTWGFAAKAALLILMFIGASAGSTGGGIKVVRVMIAAKVLLGEIERVYRPKVVRPVRVGHTTIDADLKLNTLVYVLSIAFLFVTGALLLVLFEAGNGIDVTTAVSASAATLNNIGPGLAKVGATQNYAWFTAPGKILMSALMLLGRLEVFTVIVLFSPRFWRTS